MNPKRRQFLEKIMGATSLAALTPFFNTTIGQNLVDIFQENESESANTIAENDDFWAYVQQAYTVSSNIINLNNGGVSPQPLVVQQAVERYNRLSNEAPSYYMWRTLDRGREGLRLKLAELAGTSKEEIAINRNSSEALETVIFGLRLSKGDEVVLTKQDYPNMINAWKQRAKREGIVLKFLNFDFPIENKELIINTFTEA